MTIVRLRPSMTPEELAVVYGQPYNHRNWEEHVRRVHVTVGLGWAMQLNPGGSGEVADLSCGDGTIAQELAYYPIYGDITPGWPIVGPIEQTIHQIPHVAMFVLSETLEHLEDPLGVLAAIRGKADKLLLSTPTHESGQHDDNPEHYWQWDQFDIASLLTRAGWTGDHLILLGGPAWHYGYQIWGCS